MCRNPSSGCTGNTIKTIMLDAIFYCSIVHKRQGMDITQKFTGRQWAKKMYRLGVVGMTQLAGAM